MTHLVFFFLWKTIMRKLFRNFYIDYHAISHMLLLMLLTMLMLFILLMFYVALLLSSSICLFVFDVTINCNIMYMLSALLWVMLLVFKMLLSLIPSIVSLSLHSFVSQCADTVSISESVCLSICPSVSEVIFISKFNIITGNDRNFHVLLHIVARRERERDRERYFVG